MLSIEHAGERLGLLPEKAVHWPATKTLIVADLHLGKTAAFRHAGIAAPENTTAADLARLGHILQTTGSRRLIILGDLLHAPAGMQPVMITAVDEWRRLHAGLEIVLVPGNHDRKSGPPPATWNMRGVEREWPCGPFLFTHEPVIRRGTYVMAGHVHPALSLRDRFGPGLRAPCFHFGRDCAVLPAFGSFTGMSNVKPATGDRIFAIGDGEVMEIR